MTALLDYLRAGSDAEQAGAKQAWYRAHLPLRADRSPSYAPGGSRDPNLDVSRDVVDEWLEASDEQLRDCAASLDRAEA